MRASAVLLAAVALASPVANAQTPLLITYIEKPPYYHTDTQGAPRGFLIERLQQIMAHSGTSYRLEARPPNRALQELRLDPAANCSLGWFRNAEREGFAHFSLPLYHDRPLIAVALRDSAAGLSGKGLAGILAENGIRVGAVAGYSYGEEVDRMLAPLGDRVDRAPSPASNLAKLAAGRFHIALFNSEELDHLLVLSPELEGRLQRIELKNVPPGKARHLMCSRHLPAETMARIDRAIKALRFDRSPDPP